MARYDLSETEWRLIQPLLPNKPRGVARVDDRRVINDIFYVLRTGSPWRDLPGRYGPHLQSLQPVGQGRRLGPGIRGAVGGLAGKGPGSRHRPFSWRTEHQDRRPGRSGRIAAPDHPLGRAGVRQGRRRRTDRRPQARQGPRRRSGLRRSGHHRFGSLARQLRAHPDPEGSQGSAFHRSSHLPTAQRRRALLLQTQTLPSRRNPLRQASQKLPCRRIARLNPSVAHSL